MAPLTDFSICNTIKDTDTGKVEVILNKLEGFSVPAGGEARIHFDDGTEARHYRANSNSIYISSQAAKTVTFVLKADGFAKVCIDVSKDKGSAEAVD